MLGYFIRLPWHWISSGPHGQADAQRRNADVQQLRMWLLVFGSVFSSAGDDDQYHYHNHYGHHHEQQGQVNVECGVSGFDTCDDVVVRHMNPNIQCRHQQNVHEDLWTSCSSELFVSIAYSRQSFLSIRINMIRINAYPFPPQDDAMMYPIWKMACQSGLTALGLGLCGLGIVYNHLAF